MSILVIIFLSIFISTFFISMHADAAEAILITFLVNEETEKREKERASRWFNRNDEDNYRQLAFKREEIYKEVR